MQSERYPTERDHTGCFERCQSVEALSCCDLPKASARWDSGSLAHAISANIVAYQAQVTKRVLAAMTLLLLSGALFLPWGSGGLAAEPVELPADEESAGQSPPVSLSQLDFDAGMPPASSSLGFMHTLGFGWWLTAVSNGKTWHLLWRPLRRCETCCRADQQ